MNENIAILLLGVLFGAGLTWPVCWWVWVGSPSAQRFQKSQERFDRQRRRVSKALGHDEE